MDIFLLTEGRTNHKNYKKCDSSLFFPGIFCIPNIPSMSVSSMTYQVLLCDGQ